MNAPHIDALHYWVSHDDSVDYANTEVLEEDNDRFHLSIKDRRLTITFKEHYADEQEAKESVESFIRQWEFQAAIELGSHTFTLQYLRADIRDRNPNPLLPQAVGYHLEAFVSNTTIRRAPLQVDSYPSPPSETALNPDVPEVQAMLARLNRYHQGRATLADTAYYCWTELKGGVPRIGDKLPSEKRVSRYYNISRGVLTQVSRLSSEQGGSEARKAMGRHNAYTEEERDFLVNATRGFIRRAAEKAANPDGTFTPITKENLAGFWKGAHYSFPDHRDGNLSHPPETRRTL